MDLQTLEERYMTVPGTYGKLIGIWPSTSVRYQRLLSIVVYSAVIFSLATQTARIAFDYSFDTLLDQLPFMAVPVGAAIKHFGYLTNSAKFKEIVSHMLEDWKQTNSKDEEEILEYYANKGVFFNSLYTANICMIATMFLLVPFMPYILDYVTPLNDTRPRVPMYEAHYFIKNQEDYLSCIIVYNIVTLMLAAMVYIATDTMLIYAVQHSCGLLALAGHRIQNGLQRWSSSYDCSKLEYRKMYRAVSYSVATHSRALTYLLKIENAYKISLFLLVGLCVVTFTATLLRAGMVRFSAETYQIYGYVAAQLVHMFFLTAQGQFVINVYDTIYRQGFDALWYNADDRTKSLFILIMRQSLTPPMLTAGGLMQLNFDTFAEIVKASVSYFTVLKST